MTKKERAIILDAQKKLGLLYDQLESMLQDDLAADSLKEPDAGHTLDDVRAKVDEAINATSTLDVLALFMGYKVKRVSDFRPEQYANVIEALDDLITGSKQ